VGEEPLRRFWLGKYRCFETFLENDGHRANLVASEIKRIVTERNAHCNEALLGLAGVGKKITQSREWSICDYRFDVWMKSTENDRFAAAET
jgi:hypothetical protein